MDRVVRLIESPEVDLDELATAVNGDPVLAHHDSAAATGDSAPLACAMQLGHEIADQIGAGWPEDSADLGASILALGERLGLDPDRLADIAAEAETNLEALSKLG